MRFLRVTFLLSLAALIGCSAPPVTLRIPGAAPGRTGSYSPSPLLRGQIDALLPDSLFPPSQVSILVVSLQTGETLYELNSALAITPASNQKLLTAAAALTTLGPTYQFPTLAFIDTTVSPSVFLRGGGDPLLSTQDLDSLAGLIASHLPPGKSWTVIGDVSLFDDLEKGSGWCWDDDPDPTAMRISPLSLNGNTIRIRALAGARAGDSVRLEAIPPTSYISWDNEACTTDSAHSKLEISRNWREGSNQIIVRGGISVADSVKEETLDIEGAAWYTLTVFKECLAHRGVICSGLAVDTIPAHATSVAQISHGLDSILVYMIGTSDNLSAENLLKTLAVNRWGKPGTASAGAVVVKEVLQGFGVDTNRVVIADGSGVSRYNLISARTLIRILAALDARKDLRDLWRRSFPLAGVTGTLSGRMKNTPAAGSLLGKTGTLEGVSSLSGYVSTADGEPLAFSIIMEHFPTSSRPYRLVQDRIGGFLAGANLGTYEFRSRR
jgi:D-alanyl-D-alanine carboxypeptidase/D-alanyl-D-alanine-endopeptidase (penicillin-binding protein 4)